MTCYEFPPIGGGGSRVVHGLSRELVRLGHEVDVVTTRFRDQPPQETIGGVNVHRVRCVRLKEHFCTLPEVATYVWAARAGLRALLTRRSYDINHAHFVFPDGLNAHRAKEMYGLPYLLTAHGTDVPGYNPHRVRVLHHLLSPAWRRVARGAAEFVCPSRSLQLLVAQRDPALRTITIPYGFQVGRYRADRERRKRILVVTRMLRRKGVQYLLQAVRDLPLEHEIHIVGDGPFLPELRRLASGLRTPVRFYGWLDNDSGELTHLYETSDLFVLPSERENFPVSLMEAMDAGLAIITTRGTGCSEVVGGAALLVEPHDPAGLRAALASLVSDPGLARQRGDEARARLAAEFAWPVVARRYVEIYERHARSVGRPAA